jgi:hypothetical protein
MIHKRKTTEFNKMEWMKAWNIGDVSKEPEGASTTVGNVYQCSGVSGAGTVRKMS